MGPIQTQVQTRLDTPYSNVVQRRRVLAHGGLHEPRGGRNARSAELMRAGAWAAERQQHAPPLPLQHNTLGSKRTGSPRLHEAWMGNRAESLGQTP